MQTPIFVSNILTGFIDRLQFIYMRTQLQTSLQL